MSCVSGALGEDIFGEADELRRGKEVVYSSVRALNASGKLLTHANHIYHMSEAHDLATLRAARPRQAAPARTRSAEVSLPPRDDAVVARNVETLRRLDGRMPYMARLGWAFESADYGYARFRLPCRGAAVGDDGGLSSGALISAVDHAGSLAAPGLFGSTVSSKLHVLAPRLAQGSTIYRIVERER